MTERDVLLADIATLRVKKTDVGKTLTSGLGVVALVAWLVYKVVALSDTTDGT